MATPAPSEIRKAQTALKKFRTPSKAGSVSKFAVPKLKLDSVLADGPTSSAKATPGSSSPRAALQQRQQERTRAAAQLPSPQQAKFVPNSSTKHQLKQATAEGPSLLREQRLSKQPGALSGNSTEADPQRSAPRGLQEVNKKAAAEPPQQRRSNPLSSPDFSPRDSGPKEVHNSAENELPLACQTAISKRRNRQQSMLDRYGDYFSGSDFELDETLLEYSATQPAGRAGTSQSRSRKSAGPSLLSAACAEAAAGAPPEQVKAAHAPPSERPPLSRQRRRTLGPGQEVAKEVAAIMKGVNDMAEDMLPGQTESQKGRKVQKTPSQPLRERLLDSWNGQSYYDRLAGMTRDPGEKLAHPGKEAAEDKSSKSQPAAAQKVPHGLPKKPGRPQRRSPPAQDKASKDVAGAQTANASASAAGKQSAEDRLKSNDASNSFAVVAATTATSRPASRETAAAAPKQAADATQAVRNDGGAAVLSSAQTSSAAKSSSSKSVPEQSGSLQPDSDHAHGIVPSKKEVPAPPREPGDRAIAGPSQTASQQQLAVLERKCNGLQGKLTASTTECQQLKTKLKASEQHAQTVEHKLQTKFLAEQRQVKRLQAELDVQKQAAAAERERAKAALAKMAGSLDKHNSKMQASADGALEGIQALLSGLKLVSSTVTSARQLEAEL